MGADFRAACCGCPESSTLQATRFHCSKGDLFVSRTVPGIGAVNSYHSSSSGCHFQAEPSSQRTMLRSSAATWPLTSVRRNSSSLMAPWTGSDSSHASRWLSDCHVEPKVSNGRDGLSRHDQDGEPCYGFYVRDVKGKWHGVRGRGGSSTSRLRPVGHLPRGASSRGRQRKGVGVIIGLAIIFLALIVVCVDFAVRICRISAEVRDWRDEIRTDRKIAKAREEVRAEIRDMHHELRSEFRNEINAVRGEMRGARIGLGS